MEYKIFCFADDFFICAKSFKKAIRYVKREMKEDWEFSDFKKVDLKNTKINIRIDDYLGEELYYRHMEIDDYEEVREVFDGVEGCYLWDGYDWYERISLQSYLEDRLGIFHNREFEICTDSCNLGLVPM